MNPQTPQPFLPLDIPIQGTNLIEASAGTGKTWGIAALFARLILLEHYPVDSVLVVTFTKAATAELKSRLRGRLEEALACLKSEKAHQKADPFLQELLAAAEAKEGRERLLLRLKAALSQFDNAAIYTIHGFCQRILRDYAFLCQAPFEVELSEDTRASLLTPLQDFWRETVAADREKARLAVDKQQTPASVLALMGKWASKTDLVFRRPESTDLAVKRAALAESCCVVRDNLDHIEKTFWEMYPKLSGTKIKKEPTLKKFADLRDLLDGTADAADFLTVLQNSKKENAFHSQLLADCVKKGNTLSEEELAVLAPLTDLYAAACELETGETDALIHLQLDSLETLRNASEQRKKNENRRSFDDLLQDVYAALTTGQHAETLAHTVASLWKVALIDEFQDTDTLQYGIFRKIFIENGNPLFLVGDPKQAIYAFRGADIHAYLQAAEDAQNHYSLDTNRRSHRALIDGISLLFRQKTRPFVLQGIDYPKVSAHRSDSRLLPAPDAAVTVRWLLNGSNDTPNKEELRSRSADFCADEIAGLLHSAGQGRLKMQRENGETTPLQAGEIAVLVRSHKEGSLVARRLKQRGIQSVLSSQEIIWQTPEAEALSALLDFWLNPQQTALLRFVLAGVLFGQSAADLQKLNQDEAALAEHIAAAQQLLADWQQHGVYVALQNFDRRYRMSVQLLAAKNERTLSNIRQLAELLAAEDEAGHTPASLHQWLQNQIQAHSGGNEAQLRLESDEALVKIMTMHVSKGLQYPVVFCPFAWDSKKPNSSEWTVVRREQQNTLLHKSQISNEDKTQLAEEKAGEDLRLLYVALTRAEERLIIYAAPCDTTRYNPFAYLLEGTADAAYHNVEQAYKDSSNTALMLWENWQRFIQTASEQNLKIEFTEKAPPKAAHCISTAPPVPYQAKSIPERSFQFIRQTSFTGLTRNLPHQAAAEEDNLLPAMDTAETAAAMPSENTAATAAGAEAESADEYSIFHFPRGAAAGVCLHELLEHADFARPAAGQQEAFAGILQKHGFDSIWLPAVSQMTDTALSVPLPDGLTLAQTPPERRLSEMGFLMKMQDFDLGRLKKRLAQSRLPEACLQAAEALDFDTLNGLLNGFIDLTVLLSDGQACIIDYKSNHLGMSAADYHTSALDNAVAAHHYYLQALIYAIAAARYFASRKRPLDTVHIRYYFLRGLNSGTTDGIWAWDIPVGDLAEWL